MTISLVVPSIGDVTDPATIQQIYDDLTDLRADVDRLLARRVQTTTRTSNSASFTAETVTDTVTGSLTVARVYRVTAFFQVASSVAADTVTPRIREDNISGTQLQAVRVLVSATGTTWLGYLEAEYTAASTASKSFVLTGTRASGTGNISFNAAATQPTYLYIDDIRG